MSTTDAAYSRILHELRALLATVDEPMAAQFLPILERAATEAPGETPIDFPFSGGASLEPGEFPLGDLSRVAALASPATRPAMDAILDAPKLRWYQPDPDRVPPGWAHRATAVELVGPDGMVTGLGDLRLGLFYLAEGIDYPDHWHEAEEFYLLLAGAGEWTIDGVTTPRRAGDWSHTPVEAVHRIVTHDSPAFAMWGWAGNTSFETYAY